MVTRTYLWQIGGIGAQHVRIYSVENFAGDPIFLSLACGAAQSLGCSVVLYGCARLAGALADVPHHEFEQKAQFTAFMEGKAVPQHTYTEFVHRTA